MGTPRNPGPAPRLKEMGAQMWARPWVPSSPPGPQPCPRAWLGTSQPSCGDPQASTRFPGQQRCGGCGAHRSRWVSDRPLPSWRPPAGPGSTGSGGQGPRGRKGRESSDYLTTCQAPSVAWAVFRGCGRGAPACSPSVGPFFPPANGVPAVPVHAMDTLGDHGTLTGVLHCASVYSAAPSTGPRRRGREEAASEQEGHPCIGDGP